MRCISYTVLLEHDNSAGALLNLKHCYGCIIITVLTQQQPEALIWSRFIPGRQTDLTPRGLRWCGCSGTELTDTLIGTGQSTVSNSSIMKQRNSSSISRLKRITVCIILTFTATNFIFIWNNVKCKFTISRCPVILGCPDLPHFSDHRVFTCCVVSVWSQHCNFHGMHCQPWFLLLSRIKNPVPVLLF